MISLPFSSDSWLQRALEIDDVKPGTLFVCTHNYEFKSVPFAFAVDQASAGCLDKQAILNMFADVVVPGVEYEFHFTRHAKKDHQSHVYFLPREFPPVKNLEGAEDPRIAPALLLCPFEAALDAFLRANSLDDRFLVDLISSRGQDVACSCVLKDKLCQNEHLLALYLNQFDFTGDSIVAALRKVCAHGNFLDERLCKALAVRYISFSPNPAASSAVPLSVTDLARLFSAICGLGNIRNESILIERGLEKLGDGSVQQFFLREVVAELRASPLPTVPCKQEQLELVKSPARGALPALISPALVQTTMPRLLAKLIVISIVQPVLLELYWMEVSLAGGLYYWGRGNGSLWWELGLLAIMASLLWLQFAYWFLLLALFPLVGIRLFVAACLQFSWTLFKKLLLHMKEKSVQFVCERKNLCLFILFQVCLLVFALCFG